MLRGIYFIDPADEEFKEIMKNARRRMDVPMPAAMPCKTRREKYTETCSVEKKCKTKYACIAEADESARKRMEGSHHEDHIAGNGTNSLSHYNLVHNFLLTPRIMKIPDEKVAVDKEWEKLKKILGWQLTKVRNKNEVVAEARNVGIKVHIASVMDISYLKNSELEPRFPKFKGRVVLRGDTVQDDTGSYGVFTEQGSSASQMTAAKVMDIVSRLPGCSGQAADAVYPFIPIENSEVRLSRYLDTSTMTHGQNHSRARKTQSFLLSAICTVILWQDCSGKGNSREFH